MSSGRNFLLASCLATAACVQTQDVKLRPITEPAAKVRSGGGLLADARAQLALGDVGIALEIFRTLSREQPENPSAYAGIAACYAAMGRYDVARQNYEYALAYAPNDPDLLTALASTVEQLGQKDQGAQIRLEAARTRAAPATATSTAQNAVTPLGVPQRSSITLELPRPLSAVDTGSRFSPHSGSNAERVAAPLIAGPQLVAPAVMVRALPLDPRGKLAAADIEIPAPTPAVEATTSIIAPPRPTQATIRLSSSSVVPGKAQFALDPAIAIPAVDRLQEAPAAQIAAPRLKPTPVELASEPLGPRTSERTPVVEIAISPGKLLSEAPTGVTRGRRSATPARQLHEVVAASLEPRTASAPYLERASQGEVALITTAHAGDFAPIKHPLPRQPDDRSTAGLAVRTGDPGPKSRLLLAAQVRWVPLGHSPAPVTIQLLNAARTQSLANRTRAALLIRGWRKIGIGDAQRVRQHSLVLYASARSLVAYRLAAQFDCKAVRSSHVRNIVVLLGRDAVQARRWAARA